MTSDLAIDSVNSTLPAEPTQLELQPQEQVGQSRGRCFCLRNFHRQIVRAINKACLAVLGALSVVLGFTLAIPMALLGGIVVGPLSMAFFGITKCCCGWEFDDEPMQPSADQEGAPRETPYRCGFKLTMMPIIYLLGGGGAAFEKVGEI